MEAPGIEKCPWKIKLIPVQQVVFINDQICLVAEPCRSAQMPSEKVSIKDVVSWVEDFFVNGEIEFSDIIVNEHKYGTTLSLSLFTERHKYNITVRDEESDSGYLGCVMSNRAPYPGETHTRGADLPDGPLNRKTWVSIMDAIIKMEKLDSGRRPLLFDDIVAQYRA